MDYSSMRKKHLDTGMRRIDLSTCASGSQILRDNAVLSLLAV